MTVPFSLPDRLLEYGRTQPDSVAVVMGHDRVSYAELAEMAVAARSQIESSGCAGSSRIAVRAEKSAQTIALIVACMMARRSFLLPSTALGAGSLGALLGRADCQRLLSAVPADGGAGIRVEAGDVRLDADSGEPQVVAPAGRLAAMVEADVSFMLTTSGSTGLPKIVPLSAGAVDRFTDWAAARFRISSGTRVLSYAPLSFDLCLLDIWATLKVGGTVVLVDEERATDGRYLAELVRAERIQVVQSVPMFYGLLANAYGGQPFAGVEQLIVTGDKAPTQLLGQLPSLFPNARIYNVYGSTETNDSFLHEVVGVADIAVDLPIGRPIDGVDALVVDVDDAVLDGPAEGELLVRTPFQTAGYLDPAASVGKFVAIGDGKQPYFRTGDLVRRDAHGVYTLLGRRDFQVKVRGTRVNLAEVEHVILGHSAVLEAAVVGVPDEITGTRIHAVVRRSAPGSPNSLILRERCRLQLPRAAIPTTIDLVDTPLPATATGKVDRQALIRAVLDRR
ncbi:AMP-binding protein [Micromonospora sp. NPDC051196]|uniref:AMP-binding protein n=1 Tax=Micromonospora sp. NPDC051196 TaxID=3155281 RepID=UPI0034146D35